MSEEDTDGNVSLPRQVTFLLPPKENVTSQRKMDLGRKQLMQAGRSLGTAAQARRPDVTQQHAHRCFYVCLQPAAGKALVGSPPCPSGDLLSCNPPCTSYQTCPRSSVCPQVPTSTCTCWFTSC